MIHPDTEVKFISKEIGYGVVATEQIPAGTITWALDKLDQIFDPAEVANMSPFHQDIIDTYCFRNSSGQLILCWDNGRFVNHSFNANCLTTAYDFEIAIRDIAPGEQLTDDYGYLNIDRPFKGIDEGTERKYVYPDDLLKFAKVWDAQLLNVFDRIPQLSQALRPLIEDRLWSKIETIAAREEQMESIAKNYFHVSNLNGSS